MSLVHLGGRKRGLVAVTATGCSQGRNMLIGMNELIPKRSHSVVPSAIVASPEGMRVMQPETQ